MFSIINNISPLVVIPYMLVALSVISYFAYLKYLIRKEIKHLPAAIYGVDVNIVRKNLQIKSMVYNFILITSIIEFVTNIVIETDLLVGPTIEPESPLINVSDSCRVEDINFEILGRRSTFFYSRTRNIAEVVFSEMGILMALFYIILRRMYLNISYHKHIRKYIIYIVFQFVVKSVLLCFMQTYYFGVLLFLPFVLIDGAIYIFASQKFYALLKGMRNAASLHSTKRDYFERKRAVRRFFYAQLVTIFLFLLLLTVALTAFIQVSFRILTGCFLSYITSDLIPTITLSDQVKRLVEHIIYNCRLAQMGILFVVELITVVIYLALCVDIIVKAVTKRRRYSSSNFLLTRPLMEKYRTSLLNH